RVRALLGAGVHVEAAPYRVVFGRGAESFTATIRSDDGAVVRRLSARETGCASLAHATSLALAVLFDAELAASIDEAARETRPPPPPKPVQPPPPVAARRVEAPRKSVHVGPAFSAGAGALAFVIRPVVPVLVADAGVTAGAFRVSAGLLWAPPQTLSLP